MSHQSGSAHRSNHGYIEADMDVSGVWIEESRGHCSHPAPNRFYRDIQVKHAAELLMRQGGSKAQQMFRNNGKTF
jgi:hypothetical protein